MSLIRGNVDIWQRNSGLYPNQPEEAITASATGAPQLALSVHREGAQVAYAAPGLITYTHTVLQAPYALLVQPYFTSADGITYTCTTAGLYEIQGEVIVETGLDGYYILRLLKNGTSFCDQYRVENGTTDLFNDTVARAQVRLDVGDLLTVQIFRLAGTPLLGLDPTPAGNTSINLIGYRLANL